MCSCEWVVVLSRVESYYCKNAVKYVDTIDKIMIRFVQIVLDLVQCKHVNMYTPSCHNKYLIVSNKYLIVSNKYLIVSNKYLTMIMYLCSECNLPS